MRRVMQVLILNKIQKSETRSEIRDQETEKKNTREGTRSPIFPGLIIADPEAGSRVNWRQRSCCLFARNGAHPGLGKGACGGNDRPPWKAGRTTVVLEHSVGAQVLKGIRLVT
jgi:hypothetical protein